VDIRAELEDGSGVVIENQFGDSNHDHLGKIITYRTAFDAKVAIWIVEKAKEEHVEAVNWLNETDNGCDFYLLELQLIRIGDSPLGPLFTIKSAPSKEAREKGELKRQETRRHEMRYKFWTELLKVFKADKTMPAFKRFDKLAIAIGGGDTHRYSLDDMVMIKDNHIAVVGSVKEALAIAKENISFSKKIEIEVETKEDAIIAAEGGADIVMFDNMGFEESQEALKLLEEKNLRDRVLIEFSGDVNEDNILDYALLDVDIISLGALTHSSRSLNLGLDMD
jgi:hypothetical protein